MGLNKPKNSNYCATVVEIKNIVELSNCDNVVHAIIFGNKVVVGKDTNIGDIGLFFPVETALSKEYLAANNLYRKKELNLNTEKAGYFEENGRIRCVKFRGNNSEGLFMPINSLNTLGSGSDFDIDLKENDEFDELFSIPICHKYIPKNTKTPGQGGKSKQQKQPKETKLIENQFRFHSDTSQLYKNIHQIKPDDLISITYKLHGTSGISSKVLCKKSLKWYEKVLKKLGVDIVDSGYDYLYSSRKVIKNEELLKEKSFDENYKNMGISSKKRYIEEYYIITFKETIPNELYRDIFPLDNVNTSIFTIDYFETKLSGFKGYLINKLDNLVSKGYYGTDIWGDADKQLREFIQDGMTLYYEIVGHTSTGGEIQKGYDYGHSPLDLTPYGVYIYRITNTNVSGKVFEFSAKQVQDWCKGNGLNAVPELYYGKALGLAPEANERFGESIEFSNELLATIKTLFNDKDCYMCTTKVPEEGCVVRVEGSELKAFKCKSPKFYEHETKQLDKGIVDMETEN